MGINFKFLDMFIFFILKKHVAADLHFMTHHGGFR